MSKVHIVPEEFLINEAEYYSKNNPSASKYIKSIQMQFPSTEMPNEWINSAYRTPELIKGKDYSENVLAVCNGELMVMTYSYLHGEEGGYFWANCNGDINGDGEIDDDYDVTHWMPLPSPPNK